MNVIYSADIKSDRTSCIKNTIITKSVLIIVFLMLSGSAFSESLTLEQVIREVCEKSDSAKMMKESVVRSDAVVRENKAAAWPKITAAWNSNHSEPINPEKASIFLPPIDTSPMHQELMKSGFLTQQGLQGMIGSFAIPQSSTTNSGSVAASMPVFNFSIWTAIEVAKTYRKSAQSAHSRNLQTLQLLALDMFYRTMLAIESSKIAERTLLRKNELYNFISGNFALGSGVKAQMLMTKADAFSQSAVTITARRDAESARMFLNIYLGRNLTDEWTIDTSNIPGTLQKTQTQMADSTIFAIIDQREDIHSLKLMAESTRGGAKIFNRMWWPSLYANGSLGYMQIDSKGIMARKGGFDASIGASLQCQLFDGFQNRSKAAEFLSDARKIEIAEGTVKKAAEIEIRSAIIECGAADSTLFASQEMYKAASEGYDLTNSNFKQGSGSLTDLQRVDEQLQLAEFSMLNARYRQVRSRAALLISLGQDIVDIK